MIVFSWSRFQRLFLNDLQIHGKKLLMGSVGALLIGLLLYLQGVSGANGAVLTLYRSLFTTGLLVGGFVLTSMMFGDMHHPLECNLYLMQPVSNFERLLSRYLITGPLFYLYFCALYYLFEVLVSFIAVELIGEASQFFVYGDPVIQRASRIFFAGHAVVLLGAIYFRSFGLIKTILTLAALVLACFAVLWLSMRIIFWDYFPSFFSIAPIGEPGTSFNPAAWAAYIHWTIAIALYFWVLFIAYITLQDHEA